MSRLKQWILCGLTAATLAAVVSQAGVRRPATQMMPAHAPLPAAARFVA